MEPVKMPFGKHKGQLIPDIIASDPGYIEWLLTGADLSDSLREIINNGGYPLNKQEQAITMLPDNIEKSNNDSLEHNKLQMRFLENELVMKVACTYAKNLKNLAWHYEHHGGIFPLSAKFEFRGVDVFINDNRLEKMPAIELKPTLFEDYPNVLRQIQRANEARRELPAVDLLIVEEIKTKSASYEKLQTYFERSGVRLITLADLECISVPVTLETYRKNAEAEAREARLKAQRDKREAELKAQRARKDRHEQLRQKYGEDVPLAALDLYEGSDPFSKIQETIHEIKRTDASMLYDIRSVLDELGVNKVSDLTEDDYLPFYFRCQKILLKAKSATLEDLL